MSAATLNVRYRTLVSEMEPQVIHDDSTNEKFIHKLRDLDNRWPTLGYEERRLHELLLLLIEDFETRTYNIPSASPVEVIEELMNANGLKQKDLVGVFPTESVISDVLAGKRALTVEHIKKLSERFAVSPALFFDLPAKRAVGVAEPEVSTQLPEGSSALHLAGITAQETPAMDGAYRLVAFGQSERLRPISTATIGAEFYKREGGASLAAGGR
jgi:HTH-type transcriptional regulator/antitoxin HigA